MSGDATYRIEVEHDPHSDRWPWDARVYRLSDGFPMHSCHAATATEAAELARQWVRQESARQTPPRAFYVDDDGEDACEPGARLVKLAPGEPDPRD